MAGGKKQPKFERREVKIADLEAILERAKAGALSDVDHQTLRAAVDTLAHVTHELESKNASIARLKRMLFGASTEKTGKLFGESTASADDDVGTQSTDGAERSAGTAVTDAASTAAQESPGASGSKPKRKGHGRTPAAAYRGAQKVQVPHDSLHRGEHCPECQRGKLYRLAEPAVLVRVLGMAPLQATVYEQERLRCNLCGEVFSAKSPPGVGGAKYDETATAMVALLKYGCGLPFHRLERLQKDVGIPLPAATQWELVELAAEEIAPAHAELIRQAAQGEVLHNDDTKMKILDVAAAIAATEAEEGEGKVERKGIFTSGIVSTRAGWDIALFFTGRRHAGENLAGVLAQRAQELPPPIQMCDGLSHNTAGDFDAILANCTCHARRRFVDVLHDFPAECRHVLETLRDVYHNDAISKQRALTPEERLHLHQTASGPLMDGLEAWMSEQLKLRKVEPNSGLGEAIAYAQKHWNELTLFLREPGAPLDNNICERALKKAILHRKNSLFYRTENGARVGDLFMSLIHTAELCGADPFRYLVALQRHRREMARDPSGWMPWNYHVTLAAIGGATIPTG